VQWLAFKDRERLPALEARMLHDLPAHMELNVRMSSGYVANWMFEVAWTNGPESIDEIAEEAEAGAAEVPPPAPAGGTRQPGRPQGGRNVALPTRGNIQGDRSQ
jgi:hypothetical protein